MQMDCSCNATMSCNYPVAFEPRVANLAFLWYRPGHLLSSTLHIGAGLTSQNLPKDDEKAVAMHEMVTQWIDM